MSKINKNLNSMKIIYFEYHECFLVKMSLQLISMPGCDNKSLTISGRPLMDAIINGVVSNFQIEFQK